ncbi:MAG TPA: T9SS type A sorting domain-containing protein [Bacteroidia bacterium]|nr:T9SS type A sorting domain-containing protein [Bacteroidia bacterium]
MSVRHFILFITVVFFYKGSNAQFILAGQHNPDDYYVLKDTIFYEDYGSSANYFIDVNGDGVIDCTVKINLYMASHQFLEDYEILPQNSSQIAWSAADTCFYNNAVVTVSNLARNFHMNDSINQTAVWKNTELVLSYWYSAWGGPSCTSGQFNYSDTGFVGIRIFTGKDTTYGWIRITWYNGVLPMLEVLDYACSLTGEELQNLTVYPNPSTGVFTFRSSRLTPQTSVKVYNMLGQMVYYCQVPVTNSACTINLSGKAAGMYFYKVISETGDAIAKGKLIVK